MHTWQGFTWAPHCCCNTTHNNYTMMQLNNLAFSVKHDFISIKFHKMLEQPHAYLFFPYITSMASKHDRMDILCMGCPVHSRLSNSARDPWGLPALSTSAKSFSVPWQTWPLCRHTGIQSILKKLLEVFPSLSTSACLHFPDPGRCFGKHRDDQNEVRHEKY